MDDLTFKSVMRYDSSQRKIRLFRVIRNVGVVGDGKGFSQKHAFALRLKLFGFWRGLDEWRLTLLGVEYHNVKSFGGRFV